MKYIDIHTHVNLVAFKNDYDEVIKRSLEAGVYMINVGTEYSTSKRAVEFLDRCGEGVYATVGLHPLHTSASYHDKNELDENESEACKNGEIFNADKYGELLKYKKVIAIGECGLDYFQSITEEEKKRQIEAFEAQIAFANKVNKPLMLHLRSGKSGDAYKEALEILKKNAKVRGNAHFFAGSLENVKEFWNMGFSTSFTGVVTFTNDYNEVIENAPENLIHAETDAPYVAPVPVRGTRNEPVNVQKVVQKMSEIRNVKENVFAKQLLKNAEEIFAVSL